jgi:hypothetical protein
MMLKSKICGSLPQVKRKQSDKFRLYSVESISFSYIMIYLEASFKYLIMISYSCGIRDGKLPGT